MSQAEQPCYTLINVPILDAEPPNEMQLKQDLEKGDVKVKTDALKKTIQMILNGEKMPGLLMTIIRFVMPSQDHTIKKLLLIFWEIVPKYTPEGKMLQELILVCDAYRKDLQHANEFIRGSTLRFLCKLKEPELLEPLMPAIRTCLDHRHAYVRRNAVLAIYTIYRNHDFLIPDAPELIANFLDGEQDMSCKRNAFMMLIHADQERALSYLSSCIEQVTSFGDILQLVIVELIYKVCHANPSERARFIRCIYNLLNSSSPAVRYEAAGTLITLSTAPTAVKAAASCYIELIIKESDNNVKLIVLDRLIELKDVPAHEKVMQELVMDILRVLATPDFEVRKKTLSLALDLVTSRTVGEMVLVLKKEVVKTSNNVEVDVSSKYRQLLVRTLHECSVKFPDVASTIIPVLPPIPKQCDRHEPNSDPISAEKNRQLMEFLSDQNELAASDVLVFIREAIQRFDSLGSLIIEKLLDVFPTVKSVKIFRASLWILCEYCTSVADIQSVMTLIRQSLGEIPIVDDEMKKAAGEVAEEDIEMLQGKVTTLVTADGTYATQSAFVSAVKEVKHERPPLRQFMADGDFFIGASLATSLTKLALRYAEIVSDTRKQNAFFAEAMLIMATVIHYGKSGMPEKAITDDDVSRIVVCLRVLSERQATMGDIFSKDCRASLSTMLQAQMRQRIAATEKESDKKTVKVQADDPITFMQLLSKSDMGTTENVFELTLSQALGVTGKKDADPMLSSKLNKVTQLTGFSDPVYAEAYITVNQYDIILDVLVVNQTSDTLQNLTLEFATLGDLKLVEKPQPVTMGPHDFSNIKANVKVASTENGIIFGNIVYDVSGAASDRNCVVLNDIHIDIMDYIVPATCTDTEFRQMWAEFEWENKVVVNTNISDIYAYLKHLISTTNMRCLTPEKALSGDCGFMAANLFAQSIFGENVLANLSIEKASHLGPNVQVHGHIRIRAKSQGMALSMGDKINNSQKKTVTTSTPAA